MKINCPDHKMTEAIWLDPKDKKKPTYMKCLKCVKSDKIEHELRQINNKSKE